MADEDRQHLDRIRRQPCAGCGRTPTGTAAQTLQGLALAALGADEARLVIQLRSLLEAVVASPLPRGDASRPGGGDAGVSDGVGRRGRR